MGRPALSAEAIANNKIRIVKAAMEMIREGGISSVTARTLGARTGINSALIYRYFRDIDEVILFACVHVLQEYNQEMTDSIEDGKSSGKSFSERDIYLLSWELFCRHAFSDPEAYNTLFFSKHSAGLLKVIKEYYELFNKDDTDDAVLERMYRTSNLRNRNLIVLTPVLEGKLPEEDIIMLNDMTVSYFFALLVQLIGKDSGVTAEIQTERMLKACRYTIGL